MLTEYSIIYDISSFPIAFSLECSLKFCCQAARKERIMLIFIWAAWENVKWREECSEAKRPKVLNLIKSWYQNMRWAAGKKDSVYQCKYNDINTHTSSYPSAFMLLSAFCTSCHCMAVFSFFFFFFLQHRRHIHIFQRTEQCIKSENFVFGLDVMHIHCVRTWNHGDWNMWTETTIPFLSQALSISLYRTLNEYLSAFMYVCASEWNVRSSNLVYTYINV